MDVYSVLRTVLPNPYEAQGLAEAAPYKTISKGVLFNGSCYSTIFERSAKPSLLRSRNVYQVIVPPAILNLIVNKPDPFAGLVYQRRLQRSGFGMSFGHVADIHIS